MAVMVNAMHWTDNYAPGVPATIEEPTLPLTELIDRAAREAPNHPATTFFGRTLTYRQLADQVSRTAEGLRLLGVRPGDRVGLVLPNCPQHVIAFYAVLRLGAVVVEHNPLYTSRELRHMFEDHAARVAICWDAAAAKLQRQPDDIIIEHIVAVNLLDEFPASKRLALGLPVPALRRTRAQLTARAPGTIPWRKLLSHGTLSEGFPSPAADDIAAIQYTSGTTALPKGAILSHANIFADALQARAWFPQWRQREETVYAILPMFHVFGIALALTVGVLIQARIVLFPTPDPALIVAEAKHRPPTILGGVPPIFHAIAAEAKRRHVRLDSARVCFSGAMSLTPETVEVWASVSDGALIEGYGMTEASPVITGNPASTAARVGSIGVPFPSTRVKVVDLDDPTREVAQGEPGELLAQGPQIFQGYWNNPAETEQTLLPGGWLRTGDVVTQADDGFLTIVDRKKELIITGGFNVAPTEVEAILRSHPDIVDAAVVGLPQPPGGERVAAAVVLRPDVHFDQEALRDYCRERLARYKVPKRIVPVDELPLSMLGKVLRSQVRDTLLAEEAPVT